VEIIVLIVHVFFLCVTIVTSNRSVPFCGVRCQLITVACFNCYGAGVKNLFFALKGNVVTDLDARGCNRSLRDIDRYVMLWMLLN
jgi:hypothetical protein